MSQPTRPHSGRLDEQLPLQPLEGLPPQMHNTCFAIIVPQPPPANWDKLPNILPESSKVLNELGWAACTAYLPMPTELNQIDGQLWRVTVWTDLLVSQEDLLRSFLGARTGELAFMLRRAEDSGRPSPKSKRGYWSLTPLDRLSLEMTPGGSPNRLIAFGGKNGYRWEAVVNWKIENSSEGKPAATVWLRTRKVQASASGEYRP